MFSSVVQISFVYTNTRHGRLCTSFSVCVRKMSGPNPDVTPATQTEGCVVTFSSSRNARIEQWNSTNPEAGYPERLDPSRKLVQSSIKLTFLEVTGYRFKYSTVLWRLELQIRRGQKFLTQVRTVNTKSQNSDCQCGIFSKKNPVILIFCIRDSSPSQFNPDKWSYTVLGFGHGRFLIHPLQSSARQRCKVAADNTLQK
jgi:hypothetical protein